MGAALLIARSRLRRNVVATVLLVVLAGLGGAWWWRRSRASAGPRPDGPRSRPTTPPLTRPRRVTPDFEFPAGADDDFAGPRRRWSAGLPGVEASDAALDDGRGRPGAGRRTAPVAAGAPSTPVAWLVGRSDRRGGPPDRTRAGRGDEIDEEQAALLGVGHGDQSGLPYTASSESSRRAIDLDAGGCRRASSA